MKDNSPSNEMVAFLRMFFLMFTHPAKVRKKGGRPSWYLPFLAFFKRLAFIKELRQVCSFVGGQHGIFPCHCQEEAEGEDEGVCEYSLVHKWIGLFQVVGLGTRLAAGVPYISNVYRISCFIH